MTKSEIDALIGRKNKGQFVQRHGHCTHRWKSPTYNSWQSMISRCTQPNTVRYHNYGGRGIAVCDRWRAFENFLENMGERPAERTLDRIDNSGNYEPSNCRWATQQEQNHNRRDNMRIEINGETKTAGQWAAHFGLHRETFRSRIVRGWSIDEAIGVLSPVVAARHPALSPETIAQIKALKKSGVKRRELASMFKVTAHSLDKHIYRKD